MSAAKKAGPGYSLDSETPFVIANVRTNLNLFYDLIQQGVIDLQTRLTNSQLEEILKNNEMLEGFDDSEQLSVAERILQEIKEYEAHKKTKFRSSELRKFGWTKFQLEYQAALAGSLEYVDMLERKEKDKDDYYTYCDWLCRNPEEYRRLTDKEQSEFLERIQNGEVRARREFLKHNLRLVTRVAKDHYARKVVDKMQLIAWGNAKIIRLIDTWKPEKGAFSTYVYKCLWREFSVRVDEYKRGVRVPKEASEDYAKMAKFINFFVCKHGRQPIFTEVKAEFTDMTDEIARSLFKLYNLCQAPPVYMRDYGKCMKKTPFDAYEAKERREAIEEALKILKPKQQKIIRLRYLIPPVPKTLEEVGKICNLTRERIRQIEKESIDKIHKRPLLMFKLEQFL
jgi:RNA polymerase sigma factor (sigma-70 family)